jgi:hypothetical protein
MRLTHLTLTGLCVVLTVAVAMAKDKKPEKQMDMQAMMETYQKLATPGEPHNQFASLAGSWTTKTKEWMEPNKPPTESTGSCEQKMLLDGRFLHQECTGEMMGQPFNGIGVMGYDNHTKKYVSTWMDSMGTGIFLMEGTASADGKTITQKGSYNDPIEGPMKLRGVTKIVDDNTEIFEMYSTGEKGKEAKMMEITYTRKP